MTEFHPSVTFLDSSLGRIVLEFCDVEIVRFDLTKPWRVGKYVYATDGSAAIRVPEKLLGSVRSDRQRLRRPKITAIYENHWLPKVLWRPLPKERLIAVSAMNAGCPYCDRTHPKSREDCGLCHGSRRYRKWMDLGIPGIQVAFNVRYVRLLRALPGIQWCPPGVTEVPAMFQADGGIQAFVMPREHVQFRAERKGKVSA